MEEQEIKGKDSETKKHREILNKQWIDFLKKLEFKTVLEYGCGFGWMAKLMLENFDIEEYVGIDISAGQINNSKKQGLDKAKFYHSEIIDFSTEQKFDLVFGTGVLMHVPKKQIVPSFQKLNSFSKKYLMNMGTYYPVLEHKLARHCFNHNYKGIYTKELGLDVKVIPMDRDVSVFYAEK